MKLYPGKVAVEANRRLIGNARVMEALQQGREPRTIEQESQEGIEGFLALRERYLIY